jgi:hypothetical protein
MPDCSRCGQPEGIDAWLAKYAIAVLPSIREKCSTCREAPTCSRCGTTLPPGWDQSYCRQCRAEYDHARYRRKGGRKPRDRRPRHTSADAARKSALAEGPRSSPRRRI